MLYNENLCPSCFEEIKEGVERCPRCNYYFESYKKKNIYALRPMTILVDRYIIGRVIGSGGFGITYKAKDLLTEKCCAVKEYLPFELVYRKDDNYICPNSIEKNKHFEDGRSKFINEAKMLLKFKDNNNIVNIENFFSSNNTAYLVMEYLDGLTFKRMIKLKRENVSFKIARDVFLGVASALKDLHKENVLHRDISSDNIFITKEGQIKLIDFGTSRQVIIDNYDGLSVELKKSVAPIEQYERNGNQGPWTDIYSLANTFYSAVSGEYVPEAPQRVIEDTKKPLKEVCNSVPPDWCKMIDKSLNVYPEERYQSIDDMLEDINVSAAPVDKKKDLKPSINIEKCKFFDKKEKNIPIEKDVEYCIGRSMKQSDIVVDMVNCISRRHCCIKYNPSSNEFCIKDISINGTFSESGARFAKEKYETVKPGTLIYLGSRETAIRLVVE